MVATTGQEPAERATGPVKDEDHRRLVLGLQVVVSLLRGAYYVVRIMMSWPY